jgi:abequosyltransferase
MKNPVLSICIPTYNRAVYLGQLLSSITSQAEHVNSCIEICISDNASTDDTAGVVGTFSNSSCFNIVYSRNASNIGPDANFLKVVEIASGDYCWIVGSDDALLPGSIGKVLQQISEKLDILVFNRVKCDIKLSPVSLQYWCIPKLESSCFELSSQVDFVAYCSYACSIGALFSYLSCIVFRRSRWNEIKGENSFIGTAYVHVYKLLSLARDRCLLSYVNECFVLSRGENDSFLAKRTTLLNAPYVDRCLLDLKGYLMLAKKIFPGDKSRQNAIFRVLRQERKAVYTVFMLRLHADPSHWPQIKFVLLSCGYSPVVFLLASLSRPILLLALLVRRRKLLARCNMFADSID